ncbi:MAG: hypothetical protein ACOH15_11495 [Acetobacterium sp.]
MFSSIAFVFLIETSDRIHIDPCVMNVSTENNSLLNFTEEIQTIKILFPLIHVTGAISNMSFGLPIRLRESRPLSNQR